MGGIVYESTGTDYISFKVESNTERMRLLGSEKLTIGTNFNNNSGVLNIAPSSGTAPTMYFEQYTSATNGTLGEISFGNRAVDGQLALIQVKNDGANDSAYMAFHTEVTSGALTERLRIDSSGNVGIGTTSPDTALMIRGDFDGSSGFNNTNPNKGLNISKYTGAGSDYGKGDRFGITFTAASDSDTDYAIAGIYGQVTHVSSYVGGSIIFATRLESESVLTPKMAISSSGNVGIGIESPATLLHIGDATTDTSLDSTTYLKIAKSGVVRMQLNSTNSNVAALHFGDTADVDIGSIEYTNSSNQFDIYSNASHALSLIHI